jgi:thiopeptide-type bacteriocin biosynthesis protein
MTHQATPAKQSSPDSGENGQWVQLNVELVRDRDGPLPSARALFDRLEPVVTDWRSRGWLRWFFFMRKSPDVRLRFFVTVDRHPAIANLAALMDVLQREQFINLYFFSEYQPETERFGGIAAMSAVHQYFDLDTALWPILDRLDRQQLRQIPKESLLPNIIHDLSIRTMLDQVSILSVWRSLSLLLPTPEIDTCPPVELLPLETLGHSRSLTKIEAHVLQQYAIANNLLAQELTHLHQQGLLTQHLADILATISMFNLHRHGFHGHHSAAIVSAILQSEIVT